MTENTIKACVDCKHFMGQQAQPYLGPVTVQSPPECRHPEAASRDMIYGKALCQNERNDKKGCGKQGRLWTPK